MSRAAIKSDVDRTAIMLDLIHRRYLPAISHQREEPSVRYVVMEEVAPGTGWSSSRYADVLVLSCWRSDGHRLDGYEIKASRTDLKRELADPAKHHAIARYCDSWTLVVWDRSILIGLTIPETWGILVAGDDDLHKIKKPAKLQPEVWPKAFVCSLVRNAFQQSPGAAYLARACEASYREGQLAGESITQSAMDHQLEPLIRHLYGKDYWQHRDIETEKLIAKAISLIPSIERRVGNAVERIISEGTPT